MLNDKNEWTDDYKDLVEDDRPSIWTDWHRLPLWTILVALLVPFFVTLTILRGL